MRDAGIKQTPTRADQRRMSVSVCYTTLSQWCGAVCTAIAECWHTARAGGINTLQMTIYTVWYECMCEQEAAK